MAAGHCLPPPSALLGLIVCLLLAPAPGLAAPKPTAKAALGSINGGFCDGIPSVSQFLGIPYAEPPVGSKRFAAPVKYARAYPKSGLAATKYGPICPQDPVSYYT